MSYLKNLWKNKENPEKFIFKTEERVFKVSFSEESINPLGNRINGEITNDVQKNYDVVSLDDDAERNEIIHKYHQLQKTPSLSHF